MAYDGRLLRLAQERYEADRTRREAELAAQREEIYARRPRLREIQEQLRYILDLQLQDNAKASFLQPSGAYLRKEIRSVRVDSQEELMRVSLHRPEQAPAVSEKPSALHRLLGRLFGKDSP